MALGLLIVSWVKFDVNWVNKNGQKCRFPKVEDELGKCRSNDPGNRKVIRTRIQREIPQKFGV